MDGHTQTSITLRPVSSGGDKRRLGLYTAEFREYVVGKIIKELNIVFEDGVLHVIPKLKTYVDRGSITNPIVNEWLHRHGWITPDDKLQFTLEVDNINQIHTYRFVKHL